MIYLYEVKLVGLFWDLPKIVSWWCVTDLLPLIMMLMVLNNNPYRENLTLVVLALASIEVYRRLRSQAARARKSSGEGK